jgi:energy-coupling factor transporter ATP-binding protein EcfA2
MAFLSAIRVEGLFGLYDHDLSLRRQPPVTIVSGPNGIGKTTLLGLTNDLLRGSYRPLVRHDFARLRVSSDNGLTLQARVLEKRGGPRGGEAVLELVQQRHGVDQHRTELLVPLDELVLPPWLHPASDDLFYDERSEEFISAEDAARWARVRDQRARIPEPDPPEWYEPQNWGTEFIETKRLDSMLVAAAPPRPGRRADVQPPIDHYLSVMRGAMARARAESSDISQARDRTFASRLLDPAGRAPVKEPDIRLRYSEVEQAADEFRTNGLLVESIEVLPETKLTPTDRWVLRLFLQDFEAKLKPLSPVSDRLNLMRQIVNAKFLNKYLDVTLGEGVLFRADSDDKLIPADALSSGEQHEIALLSKLLFDVRSGSTVLIDEPELSLHVSWQHRMLDDLQQIANLVGLRMVIATHSTAIINGRWDLVEDLGAIDDVEEN